MGLQQGREGRGHVLLLEGEPLNEELMEMLMREVMALLER